MTLPVDPHALPALAEEHGTPLYVMSGARIRERVEQLSNALPPGGQLLYSLKANPALGILHLLTELGLGFDVCSPGDVALAIAGGCSPDRLSYVGSGVSQQEMEYLIAREVPFTADSVDQVARYGQLCPGAS